MTPNPKIKELIKSLGIIPEDEHYEVAELVVKECIAECWYDCTPKQISDNIKTKFGVK